MQEQNIEQMLENPFMQYNHIEIVSVTSDSAVMSLDIRRDTTNLTNSTQCSMNTSCICKA